MADGFIRQVRPASESIVEVARQTGGLGPNIGEIVRQTLGDIAANKARSQKIQLEERRIAALEGQLGISKAKMERDKMVILIEAKQFQAAADIFSQSKSLNPKGRKLNFEGLKDNKPIWSDDLGTFRRGTGLEGDPIKIIPQSEIEGLKEALDIKGERKVAQIGAEAEAKAAGTISGGGGKKVSFGTDAEKTSKELFDTNFGSLNKEQAKTVNELTQKRGEKKAALAGGLQKPTIRSLESKINAAQLNIGQFERIGEIFDPRFITLGGELKAGLESAKAYLDIGLKVDKKFLADKRKWFQRSKSSFLAYRKEITGVAGGEKEFKEIAKAFVDPEVPNSIAFIASLEEAMDWQKIVLRWAQNAKAAGLQTSGKDENGNPTVESTAAQNGITISQARQELEEEGQLGVYPWDEGKSKIAVPGPIGRGQAATGQSRFTIKEVR